MVGDEGAGRASLLPLRVEHEVVDDQLTPAIEQIEKRAAAARPVERVVLFDPHHRQLATLGALRVTLAAPLLLLDEQLLSCAQPRVSGHDFR